MAISALNGDVKVLSAAGASGAFPARPSRSGPIAFVPPTLSTAVGRTHCEDIAHWAKSISHLSPPDDIRLLILPLF